MGQTRRNPAFARSSVEEDWIAWLPEPKRALFEDIVRLWEDSYRMLSVALNEALELKGQGELVRARRSTEIAASLVDHLANPLLTAYRTLTMGGRKLVVVPAVRPLNPQNFRGETASHHAGWNLMLHHLLFGSRARFLHKLRVLEITVTALADEFQETAADLVSGIHVRPVESWSVLDSLHYDLNTCLRESVVLLKSFLRSLPDAMIESFQRDLNSAVSPRVTRVSPKLSRVST